MFWKRSVASVIVFADKYRYEPFFRTEVNVLALQIAFGFLLLGVATVSLSILYRDVSTVLVEGIETTVLTQAAPRTVAESVAFELSYLRSRNVGLLIGSVIVLTILFGYIIARITLSPVRDAMESQKQFIGNIAHELRTPLSTIKTNTEVRLMDKDVPPVARELHESNIEELDRISDIINNLLSLSPSVRPERIEFQNIDLGGVITTVMSKMRKLAERKQLEVTVRTSKSAIVSGNASALEQIVSNIIKNAISYTPNKGRISVTAEPVGTDTIELTVHDTGTGIARKDLFHIFEPFYRADRSRNRGSGGSGLGLAIVSELVKLHGGKIVVRSAEGRGTSVVVSLPVGQNIQKEMAKANGIDEIAIDFSRRNGSA